MSRADWTDFPGADALSAAPTVTSAADLQQQAEERRWRLMSRLTQDLSAIGADRRALCLRTAQLVSEELRDGAMVALLDEPGAPEPCLELACTSATRVAVARELFTGWDRALTRAMIEDFAVGAAGRVRHGVHVSDPRSHHATAFGQYQQRVGAVDVALAPLRRGDGTLRGFIMNTRYAGTPTFNDFDLTALAGAADTLSLWLEVSVARAAERTASRRWATIFEVTPVGMVLLDMDGHVIAANDAAAEIIGCPPGELVRHTWRDFADPQDYDSDRRDIIEMLKGRQGLLALRRMHRPDGQTRWIQRSIAVLQDADGNPDVFHLQFSDITGTVEAEREVVALAEQRRVLLGELVSAEQAERRRIADEVHDDSIQLLAAGQLRLQLVRGHLARGDSAAALRATEGVGELLASAQQELRRILLDLEDPSAPGHRLEDALQRAAEQFFADTTTSVTVTGGLTDIPPDVAGVLYRAAREAISNVRRHAQADTITVQLADDLAADHDGWLLLIDDDGIGIPQPVPIRPGHLGVRGMTSRVEALGGSCTIRRRPTGGTRVELRVPRSATR